MAANPIIQGYLNDSSIDLAKRQKVLNALKANQPESELADLISQKYGNKYQGPQGLASSVTQSLSKMSGGGDIATPSAPSSPEISGGWNTRNTTEANKTPVDPMPTQIAQPQAGQAPGSQFPKPWDAGTGESFMNSPVGKFAQAQGPMLQEAMDKEKSTGIIERAGNVLGQLGTGALNIAGGLGDVAYGGTGLNYLNPLDKRSGQEKSEQAIGGLNKLVQGTGEVVSSPLAASPILQKGVALPFEAMKSTIDDNILAAAGIDKNTEHGQNVSNSIMNAVTMALVGPKKITQGITGALDAMPKGAPKSAVKASPNQVFLERAARQAKIPENDIAALRSLDAEGKTIADQYLKHSVEKMNDPFNKKSVWTLPAKEISDFRTQAKAQLKTIGKVMEDAVNTDLKGKTVDATPVVKAFSQVLDNSNVKIIKGKLDFSGSDLAENSHAQTALTKILDSLSSNKKITGSLNDALTGTQLDARGLVSINRMMNDVAGKAESAGLGGNKLSAQLAPIKNAVEATVAPASKLYTTAKAEYANLINDLKKIDDAGKFGNKGNKGFSGQQILKRSLNTDDAKYSAAMDAIKNIESNHGIIAPKSLTTKAQLANMMEKITGTQAARSFAKAGPYAPSMAIDNVVAKVPVVGPMLRGAGELAKNANYKYFEGKIPGFKDAMGTANRAHIEAAFNLINAPEFKLIPPKVSISLLKRVAPSIPNGMIGKMSKTALEAGLVTPPAQTNKQ